MEQLLNFDQTLLLQINGWNSSFFDQFFWLVSGKLTWILFYVSLLVCIRKTNHQMISGVIIITLGILLADQIASSVLKPLVARPRPTHETEIEGMIHIVNNYRGGMYGFVSSHAANCAVVSILFSLISRNRYVYLLMTFWTGLVCYSRMYLGVHYPGDIVGGLIVGSFSAVTVFLGYKQFIHRYGQYALSPWNGAEVKVALSAFALTLIGICSYAYFFT